MNPDFVVSVSIDIEDLGRQHLTLSELALGLRQVLPDGFPKVREIQPAEHAVPVRIVALSPADGSAGIRHATQLPQSKRERLHLLVHPV
jgi:hypothetical protein